MRPIFDRGNEYIPSYKTFSRYSISTIDRNRGYSSSLTRERRSNSKNQRFDIAVSSITNISANINSLLNIVKSDKYSGFEDRVDIERGDKYSPNIHERINYRGNYTGVSPFKSNHQINRQTYGQTNKAAIKYGNPSVKRINESPKKQEILTKNTPKTYSESKNSDLKVEQSVTNIKIKQFGEYNKEKMPNQHEVSDWWENLLEEVDQQQKISQKE